MNIHRKEYRFVDSIMVDSTVVDSTGAELAFAECHHVTGSQDGRLSLTKLHEYV